jgi:hypothetical protein
MERKIKEEEEEEKDEVKHFMFKCGTTKLYIDISNSETIKKNW